jgi:GntR family transcriptional repressor for pyruvate dehydrogenase complex
MTEDLKTADAVQSFVQLDRGPSLVARVADSLLTAIVDRGLQAGERLPSERDLANQFGVSRTVIREAVRMLAGKGLVDVHTGRGLTVSAVPVSSVTETLRLYLHGRGLLHASVDAYAKVHDVRELIEVRVAERACVSATADDRDRLRRAHEQMRTVLGDVDAASAADVQFHRTIADIAHNELYVVMLDSIADVLLEIRRATLNEPGRPQRALDAHQQILDAILAGDREAARSAMQAHLDDSRRVWAR